MSYQVLARKWRPKSFREMAGQEHVLKALINALDHNRLHHAYLFTGTRGVGKTTIARILAKCFNCERGVSSEPCGTCSSCIEINEGRFIDLIEVDAASRTKVEDTRELLENVQYAPSRGRYKVYLIDEVHMLSMNSFNALLKTLEEPPAHVKFLLATTDPQKLPVTILSRCLQFNLKNLGSERIVAHLKHVLQQEMIEYEESALWQLGRSSDGSMRDALSLTDQAIGFGNGKVLDNEVRQMLGSIHQPYLLKLLEALRTANTKELLETIALLSEHNPDYQQALSELLSLLHRIALTQALPDYRDPAYGDEEILVPLAKQMPAEDIQLFYQMGIHGQRDLPFAPDPRAGFEMTLLRMIAFKPQGIPSLPPTTLGHRSKTTQMSGESQLGKKLYPAPTVPDKVPDKKLPVESDNITQLRLEDLSTDNWHLLFQQLSLTGVIHNIANHSILDSIQTHQEIYQLHLTLDEKQAALFNPGHQDRISHVISQKFSRPVQVTISVGAAHRETPAAIQQRMQQERLAAAQQQFKTDPQVQSLIDYFEGRILESSIQPLRH